tara:strand:+ start:246 stop:1475 length:1230 start_codon:yes stop_codon:yes gene_type:complete
MLKVVELFAGVGGFRIGLEATKKFEVIWSNQWEPSTKAQHASWVYEHRFGDKGHSNENIEEVDTKDIPDCDVLVGGFPCQDYSVATTLKNSKGLKGKKGVLWWSIDRIIREKKNKPKYLILENVDRLLKSPSNQRGRDFAVMLGCLNQLGYAVEWRVINAAEYGFPQRRRRVFIIAYHNSTKQFKKFKENPHDWLDVNGTNAKAFPIKEINLEDLKEFKLVEKKSSNITIKDIKSISKNFGLLDKVSRFQNSGICIGNKVLTYKSIPNYSGKYEKLGDIIEKGKVNDSFYIKKDKDKWKRLKDKKSEQRITKAGFKYFFSEGKMIFPDNLDNASRTIITGEGGPSPSRFKHVIEINGKWRRLTPVELEKLNGFPKDHTKMDGITDTKRAFFMGNALVCGVVEKIGNNLI